MIATRPLLLASIGALFGIIFSLYFPHTKWFVLFLFLLTLLIGGYRYLFWKQGLRSSILLLSFFFFAFYTTYVIESQKTQLQQTEGIAEGLISSSPEIDGDLLKMSLDVMRWDGKEIEGEQIQLFLRLKSQEEQQKAVRLRKFMLIRLPIHLEKPEPARNPGVFDYQKFLQRRGVFWFAKGDFSRLQVVKPYDAHPLAVLERLREKGSEKLEKIFVKKDHAGLFQALLLGERKEIHPDWNEAFSALGIIHILSISGLHISFLTYLSYEGWKLFGLTREKAVFLTICFLPFYVLLTGADPPVIRAAIMSGMALVAVWARKLGDTLSYLSLALLLLLLYHPLQITEVGFQLTFLITAGLIVAVEPLIHSLPLYFTKLRIAVAAALVAQILSFPVIIANYHEYSLLSIFFNLVFVPFYTLLLPVGLFLLILSLFSLSFASLLAKPVVASIDLVQYWIQWSLQWKGHLWTFPTPSFGWYLLYLFLAGMAWWLWVRPARNRRAWLFRFLGVLGLMLWIVVAAKGEKWARDHTKISFLDVGQGDSILVETIDGKTILIDAGGSLPFLEEKWKKPRQQRDVGKHTILPVLKAKGISKLDAIVLTHGDLDHIGGFFAILERFPVGAVWRNPHPAHSQQEQNLMRVIQEKGIPIYNPRIGKVISISQDVSWQTLHPDPNKLLGDAQETNNDSLVGLLQIHHTKILLTGDMEREAEEQMLTKYRLPQIDVLKVAHHGSKSSTYDPLLQAIQPTNAVISVGARNRFGHPHPEVLDRLKRYRVHIYRTDQQGAVTIRVYPDHYQIETMLGEERLS